MKRKNTMSIRKISLLVLCLTVLGLQTKAQYEIKLEIEDSKDSSLILGHYYLDKTYAIDTAYNKNGRFVFKSKDKHLESGIYFFSTLKGKYCEFMIDNEQKFSLKTKDSDWTYNMKAKGSKTAAVYFEYMQANRQLNEAVAQLNKDKASISQEEFRQREKNLQLWGDSLKNAFIEKNPQHLLSKVLTATKPVSIPEMEVPLKEDGTAESAQWNFNRWNYYKRHFFDNIDLSCSGLLRTPAPVFHRSYEYFWNEVLKYEPIDSILFYADYIIALANGSKGMKRFLIHNITERYLQSNVMGQDAIYVEMIKRYYKSGIADWLSPSAIETEVLRAEKWENLLIGKTVPNLACPDTNGVWHDIYSLNKKYKVLIFWSPDCGHCTKEVPKFHEFYSRCKQTYDLEVMAINTESDTERWKEFIVEKKLDWLNLDGLTANLDWRDYFDIVKTPVVFVLDRQNRIVAKNIQGENIEKVLELIDSGRLKL